MKVICETCNYIFKPIPTTTKEVGIVDLRNEYDANFQCPQCDQGYYVTIEIEGEGGEYEEK